METADEGVTLMDHDHRPSGSIPPAPPRPTRRSLRSRRPSTALAVGTAVLLAFAVAAPGAGAATEHQTYALAGSIVIGPPPALTLPAGATFTATVDTTTGAVTNGHVSIPTFDRGAVSGPQADITITDAAPATGTLNPTTGVATLTSSFLVSLSIPSLSSVCTLGPLAVVLSTTGGSPITGTPPTGSLTATGFTVPAVAPSATCSAQNATLVNGFLGLPTSETSMTLRVRLTAATPVTTTTTAVPAPPAAPTPAQPAFTG